MASAVSMEVDDSDGVQSLDELGQDKRKSIFQNDLKCIFGCKIEEDQEVIALTCFHFVCSDSCAERLIAGSKPDSGYLRCNECSFVIGREQLKGKITPSKIFLKQPTVKLELLCEHCVWNKEATAYCPECPACLCETCKDLHPQARATQKHVLKDDLSDYKARLMEEKKEAQIKCQDHNGATLIVYCENCDKKLCSKCLPAHKAHKTFHIENERKRLKGKVDLTRNLLATSDRAVQDIDSKNDELRTTEWENIVAAIKAEFSSIAQELALREKAVLTEARDRFFKQLAALNMRKRCVELAKESGEHFIRIAEDVLNNGADIAAIKFLGLYGNGGSIEWLSEMDEKINQTYDIFVDKDWHFKLDTLAAAETRNYLRQYCQLEYKHLPAGVPEKSTASCVTPNPAPGASGNARTPVGNKRVALKSTGTPQDSSKLLKDGVKTYPPAMLRTSGKTNLTEKVTVHHNMDYTDLKERFRTKVQKLSAEPKNQQNDDDDDDDEMRLVIVEENETDQNENGLQRNGRDSAKARRNKKSPPESALADPQGFTVSVKNPSKDSGKENSADGPKGEEVGSKLNEEAKRKSALDEDTVNKSGSEGISPESTLSLSPSEGVRGKRERKKKSFPGFIDTTESIKIQKQLKVEASTKQGRKSDSSKANNVTKLGPPPPLLSTQQLFPPEEIENGTGEGYVSSDCSEVSASSSVRRQSLRRRAGQTPGTPTTECLPKKRSRGVSVDSWMNDDQEAPDFPAAPKGTIEIQPERDIFPVQGKVSMKVDGEDESGNDDYCTICLDGGDDIIVCCDHCPKVFHMTCHAPIIDTIPEGEEEWKCFFSTSKEDIDKRIAALPQVGESEKLPIVKSNERLFIPACKFVMEVFRIPESPTMRWVFPDSYFRKYDKAPYHLKYIKDRISRGDPEPFTGVEEMLLAFRQMFIQAFLTYKGANRKYRKYAKACYEQFLKLIEEYYPEHRGLFQDVSSY